MQLRCAAPNGRTVIVNGANLTCGLGGLIHGTTFGGTIGIGYVMFPKKDLLGFLARGASGGNDYRDDYED